MDDPVEVIAVKIEPLVQPDAKRDLWVRVMNRHGMEREPYRNQDIRGVRQRNSPMRGHEDADEQDGQDIGPHQILGPAAAIAMTTNNAGSHANIS